MHEVNATNLDEFFDRLTQGDGDAEADLRSLAIAYEQIDQMPAEHAHRLLHYMDFLAPSDPIKTNQDLSELAVRALDSASSILDSVQVVALSPDEERLLSGIGTLTVNLHRYDPNLLLSPVLALLDEIYESFLESSQSTRRALLIAYTSTLEALASMPKLGELQQQVDVYLTNSIPRIDLLTEDESIEYQIWGWSIFVSLDHGNWREKVLSLIPELTKSRWSPDEKWALITQLLRREVAWTDPVIADAISKLDLSRLDPLEARDISFIQEEINSSRSQ